MATFTETRNRTPFSVFDAEQAFQLEADKMVTFVLTALGDAVLSVELPKRSIWSCFEQATLEYGMLINIHQAQNQLVDLLGTATGSLSGSQQLFIHETFTLFQHLAEPYAYLAGIGGPYNYVMGAIDLQASVQDYDLTTDLKDPASGVPIYDLQPSGSQTKLRVIEVLHFSPAAAYRFFDSTSAINYLNNEFSFESFTPETIFYVLPVFEDILRAGQFDVSQRVRRSNYSFEIIGTKLRIYPMPTNTNPRKLFVKVIPAPDPTGQTSLSGSLGDSLLYNDATIHGVSNIANVPYGNIPYTNINSIGRQWIRDYTLALCKELLGLIRSKFTTIPIPNSDLTLNGEALVAQGREDKERLVTQLNETLASLTYTALATRQAEQAAALLTVLRGIPIPPGWAIRTG